MSYSFENRVKDNREIRRSFDQLARETFGLSFEGWYQNGYWTDKYLPHVLLDGGQVVANVSVNMMDFIWENEKRRYLQLGTVMTDLRYRSRGLSRLLMEKVLSEWKDKCDGLYLFANDAAVDFYPKFGFAKAEEYQYQIPITAGDAMARKLGRSDLAKNKVVRKLEMADPADREVLFEKYRKPNPFSALPMVDNVGLLMFYCSQFMKDNIYYVEEYDAVVIAGQEGSSLVCYDIFCDEAFAQKPTLDDDKKNCNSGNNISDIISDILADILTDILAYVGDGNITDVVLGFTPALAAGGQAVLLRQEDTTLFLLPGKENLFADNKLMFPLLSHA